ncbi:MAG: TonB-dependent receptor [Halieaceae bacterium]|uniref:TonB-dependent receptor n=1 Tax=Haliea alexandrii TaxID=2448162 RepID=UPI001304D03E|nr:TonB-dependent receptor [Haliea alexandrii]MCR9184281.1 TonB-dependent receptor [Halieaceae bacterium]
MRSSLFFFAGVCCAAASVGVSAQARGEPQLEEVRVTAQKRSEPLQLVPISLVSLDETALATIGFDDLESLRLQVPGLQLLPHPNAQSTQLVFLRGVGNADEQIIQDPSVGVYLDGVYLARSQGLNLELLDIERVEVLRGPQGTLYGRNATGGAVNFVTRLPELGEWAFRQHLGTGSRDLLRSRTGLNLPLGDTAALGVGYLVSSQQGFVRNAGSGKSHFGSRDREALRADLYWEPVPSWRLRYAYDTAESEDTPAFIDRVPLAPLAADRPSSGSPDVADLRANRVHAEGHSVHVSWSPGGVFEVRSITGYRKLVDYQNQDFHSGEFGPLPLLQTEATGIQDNWSQELQFLGGSDEWGLEHIFGIYWFKEQAERMASNYTPGTGLRRLVFGRDIENTALAVFGHVKWAPPVLDRRLEMTLGGRWSEDKRRAVLNRALENVATGTVTFNPQPSAGEQEFDNFSPSFVMSWQTHETINLYAKVVEGYKSGGFNARATSPQRFSEGFDDETLVSWELGLKSDWLDRRVRLNVALFQSDYEDIQVNVQSDPNNVLLSDVLNAGSATIDGLELDLSGLWGDNLRYDIRYAWLDAGFDRITAADGTNVADRYRFIGAPRHFLTLGLEYTLAETALGHVRLASQYLWQEAQFSSSTVNAGTYIIQAHGLWNARLTLSSPLPRGEVEVALWGKNLSDEEYYTAHFNGGAGFAVPSAIWGAPRSLGVDFSYAY